MTLKLANRDICSPKGIARDVFVPVGKFTFPTDFVIVDYESDPRVPLILGKDHSYDRLDSFPSKEIVILHLFFSLISIILLSGSTTSSLPSLHISETSDYFLEEFADELTHITFPPGNDDLPFDAESNLLELEYLLNHDPIKDMDSILEDSADENSLDDNLEIPIFREFTNFATHKRIKKATNASLILEDFNPPLYELPFHKEVPGLGALLSFSSKNEEKVYNPGILTSKRVHTSLLPSPELSPRALKRFKVTKILGSPMRFFLALNQEGHPSL
ncbi:hypothetical protein Tco_0017153 [Tanacetum coccineum]